MGYTLAQKLIKAHLLDGEMTPGSEIGLKIDQTLTQDATGTMAYLEFEAMGVPRVKTERSVAYIDHNTLQTGFENADDHRYIQSVCKKHGLYFSRPGNGICHQVHLERFGIPGKTLIGSDSHTPTGGGLGMLAFGAGGLDVAVAMGGGPYYITMPKMVRVNLTGRLRPFVAAKDVILEVLRLLSVKGGVGKIIEYGGDGVKTLSVPERATITNMGAELGASTSIFPSDEITRAFMKAQGREADWVALAPDSDAEYDEVVNIDLSALRPLAACPHSPDAVKTVEEIGPIKVDQCCIGSCTNSSLYDMLKVAAILKGKTVHPDVSLSIAPGSKQVLGMLAENGALADLIAAGARILECAWRPLHRYGPVSQFRRHFPSDLQPQFRGPVGYGRRPGVSGQPRDGRGVRPGRGIHRSAYPRGDAGDRDAGILPHQRQLDRSPRPGRGHGRGGNPPWAQHQAFPGDSAPGGVHRG